jgi:hypothetical protein
VKSLNQVQLRNLILNQFNFEEWIYEKKNLKTCQRKKIEIKRMGIKFERKKWGSNLKEKNHGEWNWKKN